MVQGLDEPYAEGLERVVPFTVPMGVGYDSYTGSGHGATLGVNTSTQKRFGPGSCAAGKFLVPKALGGGSSLTYDRRVRIVLGSDEESPLLDPLEALLLQKGHVVTWVARGDPWPEVGRRVAVAVAHGQADRGVACCWTGTGVSIAANKVPGVRAALCVDAQIAAGARRWNDANVLALSLAMTSEDALEEILDAFLETPVEPEELPNISLLER